MQHLLYKFPNSQLLLQTYTYDFIKRKCPEFKGGGTGEGWRYWNVEGKPIDSRLRCEGGEGRVIVGGKGLLLGRENGKVLPDDRDLN